MSGSSGGIFGFSLPVILASIINILLLVLFIVGLFGLIRWLVKRSVPNTQGALTPLDIAKERYAKGEISQPEFEENSQCIDMLRLAGIASSAARRMSK
jgi:putative membrane protein